VVGNPGQLMAAAAKWTSELLDASGKTVRQRYMTYSTGLLEHSRQTDFAGLQSTRAFDAFGGRSPSPTRLPPNFLETQPGDLRSPGPLVVDRAGFEDASGIARTHVLATASAYRQLGVPGCGDHPA